MNSIDVATRMAQEDKELLSNLPLPVKIAHQRAVKVASKSAWLQSQGWSKEGADQFAEREVYRSAKPYPYNVIKGRAHA